MKQIKRMVALLICGAMLIGNLPGTVFAEDLSQQRLCEHHAEHVECAYSSVETISACIHQHEDDCYTVAEDCIHGHGGCGTDDLSCAHQCGAESGCVTEVLACPHQHNSECGYGITTDITPCEFVCAECVKQMEDQIAADEIAELIVVLPALEDIKAKALTDQQESYNQVQAAYDAYEKLTEEQKNLLPDSEEVFEPYFEYFNALTMEADASEIVSGTCGDNLTWLLDTNGTLTISGTGAMRYYGTKNYPWHDCLTWITHLEIVDGVSSIADLAFDNCFNLQSVSIPDSVQSIGSFAFRDCINLKSVIIPAGVTSIESNTFDSCTKLESVTLPEGLISIGSSAFNNCDKLNHVTLPEGIEEISSHVFYSCDALTEITIPASVTTIWQNSFSYCNSLTKITFQGKAPKIYENAFYRVTADVYYPEGFGWTDDDFQDYSGKLTWSSYETDSSAAPDPEVPVSGTCGTDLTWELTEEGTLTISGTGAMKNYGTTNRPWQDYLARITHLEIKDGVSSIAIFAFYNCFNLQSVSISDSVQSIGSFAFGDCINLKSVIIPAGVTSIESNTFDSCTNLETVILPKCIKEIGENAFDNCDALTEITIPVSVTTIWYYAFNSCDKLTKVTFQGKAPQIYENAFYRVTADVYYPEGFGWTDDDFQDYSGTITWIPYNTEHTHEYGDDHKCECGAIGGTCGENLTWMFDEETGTLTIDGTGAMTNYAYGSVSAPWHSARESILYVSLPNGLTTIGDDAFDDCPNLTSVTIPNGVTYIGNMTFAGCRSMTSITIPESVTTIGWGAFFGCESIESITLLSKITAIENLMFYACDSLTHVTIPDGVKSIGNESFGDCKNLSSITIPDSVAFIDEGAFMSCSKLTSITIPDAVTAIGPAAFAGCSGIKTITIPDKVEEIGCGAFMNCTGLQSITFEGDAPDFLLEIGQGEYMEESDVFQKVTATAYYPINNPTWTSGVKQDYGGDITWVAYSALIGDADCDGVVSDNDAVQLLWYAMFPDEYPLPSNGDVTGDGKVTVGDAIYVLWHTLFPEMYPIG